MEAAVKWMYSVDGSLTLPFDNRLVSLMDGGDFRGIVGEDVWKRMKLVRVLGNQAAHGGKKLTREQAALCLENLYIFLDQAAYFYAKDYTEGKFDPSLLDAGWTEGKDWLNEVELPGMPNKSGVGYADYVLYGDDGRPLAVLEAKRICVDVSKGRQQSKLYADILEKKYGRRPVVFLPNGFDTRIDDGRYPERKAATIYSKRDLEKLVGLTARPRTRSTKTLTRYLSWKAACPPTATSWPRR